MQVVGFRFRFQSNWSRLVISNGNRERAALKETGIGAIFFSLPLRCFTLDMSGTRSLYTHGAVGSPIGRFGVQKSTMVVVLVTVPVVGLPRGPTFSFARPTAPMYPLAIGARGPTRETKRMDQNDRII